MNKASQTQDAAEIAKILIKSTANYYYTHIHHVDDKDAYLKGAKEVLNILEYHSDVALALDDVHKIKRNLPVKFLDKLEIFSDVKRHYVLAFDHAIDVLSAVNTRFVVGGADSDDIFLNNILEDKNANKGFFRKV